MVDFEVKEEAKPSSEEPKPDFRPQPRPEPKVEVTSGGKAGGASSSGNHKIHSWLVAFAIIQILLLVFIAFQVGGSGSKTGAVVAKPTVAPSAAAPSAPAVKVDMKRLADDDAFKGKANAPVTIVEFSDYECPFCGRFYTQTLKQLDTNYIKTGKVKLVYRDFPLSFHPNAQKAAEAAECAGEQGGNTAYFKMHDQLFEKGVKGGVSSYKTYAQAIGLDTTKFNTCLDSGAQAAEVKKDMADGSAAGVKGTPGFLVNGRLISGAQPYAVFKQAIDAALAAK